MLHVWIHMYTIYAPSSCSSFDNLLFHPTSFFGYKLLDIDVVIYFNC